MRMFLLWYEMEACTNYVHPQSKMFIKLVPMRHPIDSINLDFGMNTQRKVGMWRTPRGLHVTYWILTTKKWT